MTTTENTTPTTETTTPTERLTPDEGQYMEEYFRETQRILGGRPTYRGVDSDDLASYASLAIVTNLAVKRGFYPDPRAYARLRLRSAAEDMRRRDQADAGLGAYGGKTCVSGDLCGFEFEGADARHVRDIAEAAAERHLLQGLVASLPADQVDLVFLVAIEQYTVTEAAAVVGWVRETASRKVNAGFKKLRSDYSRATGPAA
jgi:DNA-directed RNA polymerase specialized sigma24 family protein